MKLSPLADKKYAELKKMLWDDKITSKELLEEVKILFQEDVRYQIGILMKEGLTEDEALREIYNLPKKEVKNNEHK